MVTNLSRSKCDEKKKQLDSARTALRESFERLDKTSIGNLSALAQKDQASLFENKCKLIEDQITANGKQIEEYKERLRKWPGPDYEAIAAGFQGDIADEAGVPRATLFQPPNTEGKDDSDVWTSVSATVSSSDFHEAAETQSTSWSAGGSVGWGFLSVGPNVSHSNSHSNALKQMASAKVKISFECMRVDITRPWLRGELFYEHDLRVVADEL